MQKLTLLTLLLSTIDLTHAQDRQVHETPCCPTLDGTVIELLRLISNKPGEAIDTAAIRALFLPAARFTVHTQDTTGNPLQTADLNGFLYYLQDPSYFKHSLLVIRRPRHSRGSKSGYLSRIPPSFFASP